VEGLDAQALDDVESNNVASDEVKQGQFRHVGHLEVGDRTKEEVEQLRPSVQWKQHGNELGDEDEPDMPGVIRDRRGLDGLRPRRKDVHARCDNVRFQDVGRHGGGTPQRKGDDDGEQLDVHLGAREHDVGCRVRVRHRVGSQCIAGLLAYPGARDDVGVGNAVHGGVGEYHPCAADVGD
jgi:hypothetical protein